jgi:hypothetical protein
MSLVRFHLDACVNRCRIVDVLMYVHHSSAFQMLPFLLKQYFVIFPKVRFRAVPNPVMTPNLSVEWYRGEDSAHSVKERAS